MNEEQADLIIQLLTEIRETLNVIKNNTDGIDGVYNASDVCNKLDDVTRAIENQN